MRTRRHALLVLRGLLVALLVGLLSPAPLSTVHTGTPTAAHVADSAGLPVGRLVRAEPDRLSPGTPTVDAALPSPAATLRWHRVARGTGSAPAPARTQHDTARVRGPPSS